MRGADGLFIKTNENSVQYNRKSQYPSGRGSGVKDKDLDANTIQVGPDAEKILTGHMDVVHRSDPRITIEHNKPSLSIGMSRDVIPPVLRETIFTMIQIT